MSTPAKPRKPAKLGAAGATLWGRLVGLYVFDAREVTILEQACRQADLVAVLDREITRAGIVVEGYNGQPRLSAMVAEVRQARLALARLLGELALPSEEDARPMTARSQRAKRAADSRWSRKRLERARVEEVRADGGMA